MRCCGSLQTFATRFAGPILVAVVLSACAGTPSQPAPTQTPFPTPTTTPQTLLIWHPYSHAEARAIDQIAAAFEAFHPQIVVQVVAVEESLLRDQYTSAVKRGEGPDLLFGPSGWIQPLANAGQIESIRQHWFDPVSTSLPRPLTTATNIANAPYAVPFSATIASLYYNRVLVPTPPNTINVLIDRASAARVIIPPTFVATAGLYLNSQAQLIDGNGHSLVPQPALEAYLSELQRLAETPGITFSTDQDRFTQRRAGIYLGSSEDYSALKQALGDDLGVARLPRINGDPWPALIEFWAVMQNINNTAQTTDAAGQFIVFLVSADAQRLWFEQTHHAPVNGSRLNDNVLRDVWDHTLASGVPVPLSIEFSTFMEPLLDQAVRAVTLNGSAPDIVAPPIMGALRAKESAK